MKDIERAKHIVEAIESIEMFAAGLEFSDFQSNDLVWSAIERKLMIVGEASVYLSDETKELFSEVPWRQIKGFRNIVIHEYFGISVQMEWSVIKAHLPQLKQVAQTIIETLGNDL